MTGRRVAFEAIGTKWELAITDAVKEDSWLSLLQSIYQQIQSFDKHYSRFRPDSLVSQMASEAGTYELPADGHKLLQFYERLYRATDGKITPLIGQTMADAGYDASYSFKPGPLKKPAPWDEIIAYNHRHITLQKPALLDFGAAGKGYLVDLVAKLIEHSGIQNFSINAGGDVLHRATSKHGLQIGLENPLDATEAIGVATISNQSLCASAGSKRAWDNFTHIIDPELLESPSHIIATWVVATNTMTADGLATALFFAEPQALQGKFSFAYAREYHDTSIEHSPDFPVTLFEAEHHA